MLIGSCIGPPSTTCKPSKLQFLYITRPLTVQSTCPKASYVGVHHLLKAMGFAHVDVTSLVNQSKLRSVAFEEVPEYEDERLEAFDEVVTGVGFPI